MRHKKIQPKEIRIKRIALEGILYVQVVMISLKIMVQKKKRNKTKIKYLFQGHSARSKYLFDIDIEWVERNSLQ